MLTIASANVNGIRAAYRHGMGDWLADRKPDILLLQEVRATDEILDDLLGAGWNSVHQACDIKGRAGVAVATTLPIDAVRIGLGKGEPEVPVDTGRWVEADVRLASGEQVTVVSAYIHSGTAGTPKMDEKYAYLLKVTDRLRELAATGAHAVVAGDLNIAHTNDDIKNWKGNLKAAGFLPEERAYLDTWFDELGWVDLGRALAGPGPGPYTWWSNRGQAFDNDSGWRIDYQLGSPSIAALASNARVDRAPSHAQRWSDHAPVLVDYAL